MLDVTALKTEDLKALSKGAVTELAAQLIAQLSAQQAALTAKDEHIARRDREIKFKDLYAIILAAAKTSSVVMFLVAAALAP